MKTVPNEVLAEWAKRIRVSGQALVVVDLGPASETAVSPLRTYGRTRYFQYADGLTERLIVTVLPDARVFRALIQPRIEILRVGPDGLRIRVDVASHCSLEAVALTYGTPRVTILPTSGPTGVVDITRGSFIRPILGSELCALIQVRVNDSVYSVEHPLPFVPLNHLLEPSGLAALEVSGDVRVFVNDEPTAAVDRIRRALAEGVIAAPIVEPIAQGCQDHPLRAAGGGDGLDALVAVAGTEYLIVATSPERLSSLDDWVVERMVAELSWGPASRARRAGAGSGSRGARIRRAGHVGLQRARQRTIVGALDVLGYERYHRMLDVVARARPRNAYWEYVQGIGRSAVRPRTVLHVGFNNTEFSGHLARLAVEFAHLDPAWRQVIVAEESDHVLRVCRRLGIDAEIVAPTSRRYGRALLSSEIILTDSTLPRWFVPAAHQRLFNVWHGTPMKAMGRAIGGDPRAMSNTQRNFLQSTGVLLSNRHTIDAFVRDYMVPADNFELMPSPRNSWLFDESRRPATRRALGVTDDELVVLYLPTWRGEGNSMQDIEENVELFRALGRVAARIERPVRVFAKPHRFTLGRIDPAEMGFLLPPDQLDLYEFLAAVDCLVTDYSSVLFDFLPCNKPIILDVHDLDDYSHSRGLCIDPASLGLTMAADEDELVAAIEGAPATVDHSELTARFAPEDGAEGAQRVVMRLLQPRPRPVPATDRERVLLFPGALWTNGITTSFLNLLANIDKDARDYWVFLPAAFTSRPGPGVMDAIAASGVRYIPAPGGFVVRRQEKTAHHKFNARLALTTTEMHLLDEMMLREADRVMPGLHFDHVVNFSGYEAFIAKFFGALTLRGSQMHTWVHNDMAREQELRRNFNEPILMEAYRRSTTIEVVSEPVAARLRDGYFPPDVLSRVRVVHNTADSAKVRELAKAEVEYLDDELVRVLHDPSIAKFVTIGRFSPEKDHVRLVEAFEAVSAAHPERGTALFLIGGPGNSREMLLARVASSVFRDRIHVFEGINPHPILSRCDLFVLSSHYEGLPMVFFEALALDVPILSTAIPGPKEFLELGYGSTCEDSTSGLIEGMRAFLRGKLPKPTKSLSDFNRQAISEFEAIFTSG